MNRRASLRVVEPMARYEARIRARERHARLVYVAEVAALCVGAAALFGGLIAAIVWIS